MLGYGRNERMVNAGIENRGKGWVYLLRKGKEIWWVTPKLSVSLVQLCRIMGGKSGCDGVIKKRRQEWKEYFWIYLSYFAALVSTVAWLNILLGCVDASIARRDKHIKSEENSFEPEKQGTWNEKHRREERRKESEGL